ncbi:30S ribosome-binding factor RbfA [Helcococcus kunzii]|uniref:Ribosome-binding factor A n=1 Tax=Helcococcus kunzii ATCC 51366 TaxID=883114 RepID=H3NN30_9FIRM|nr:30S ribosome-binding factor RbfA [Helcococcus kunzii]EHR34434.1 ribosome-binding factor A [Helcococcus kunzii ATCC 51366]MCT1795432.1 30S ribosome-binding factor RbfA [Helcococcus kunzii]MCT1989781.1 30S ribosome-binding factor RbfA [Helcococcus kunzii]QUY64683.1 30S ribosome-binding factor RbfA [Helcococcus kunzii]QZO77091.1 30S ribosome-binding factor RbfA [Helcococcus kunzii]
MDKKRIKRIESELKKEISALINTELKNPRIAPITSITEVDLTDDLQSAKIYVSVFGKEYEKKETIEALQHSIGFIKRELGKRMQLRHIPELKIILDEHIEEAMRMEKLISDVIKKDEEARNEREE